MTGPLSLIFAYLALWLLPFALIVFLVVKVQSLSKELKRLEAEFKRSKL